jgi:hypothetical protein
MNAPLHAALRTETAAPFRHRISELLRQVRDALDLPAVEPVRLEQADLDHDLGYGRD